MKKVLFYNPISWNPHWETELNLAEEYKQKGWHITILKCDKELPVCVANPEKNWTTCADCKSRKSAGLRWLDDKNIFVKSFYRLTAEQEAHIQEFMKSEIESLEQLEKIKADCSDVGLAALSSVAFVLREPRPDVVKYQKLLKDFLRSALLVHYSMLNHLQEIRPDEVVLFNGRFAEIRPALQLAWDMKIDTYIHEVGGVAGRYLLTKNAFLHSCKVWKEMMDEAYDNSELDPAKKRIIGTTWFEERRNNATREAPSFITQQKKGLLPEDFSADKVNIVIFNSSDDEFVGFEEYKNPLYENQDEGTKMILESFKNNDKIKFYLRVHPFLSKLDNSQTRFISRLEKQFPNLCVIPPESPISSYSLMDLSNLVITFGSTVGIEAVYSGKPSILIGRAVYEDLNGIIKPQNHQQLVRIIEKYVSDRTLPELADAEENFFKYGFFVKNGGFSLKYANSSDWWQMKMSRNGKEKKIRSSLFINVLEKIASRLRTFSKQRV